MRPVPWHVKGVRPDAREVARDAARRSGLSVGEWLNSVIIDATGSEDSPPAGHRNRALAPPHQPMRTNRDADMRFATIGRQIDELKWQIGRLSQRKGTAHAFALDREEGLHGGQFDATSGRSERQTEGFSRAPRSQQGQAGLARQDGSLDNALAEITARQQALDGEAFEPLPYGDDLPPSGARSDRQPPRGDPSAMEQQLHEIRARIKTLQTQRFDGMATELARTIENTTPKRAIEGIEEQLRRLTSELEATRRSAPVDKFVDSLRRDLADIGRRINDAMPQRVMASIEEQIRALSDQIAKLAQPRLDMAAIEAQVRSLSDQISALHQPPRAEEIAEALRRDLDEIGAALKDTIPHQLVASIEEQIQALNAQIAELASPRHTAAIAAALRRELADVEAALQNTVPHPAVAALEEQIQVLNRHVAGLGTPPRIEEIAHALRRELADIEAALQNAVPQQAVAAIEEQIQALNAHVAGLGTPHQVDEIAHALRRELAEIGAVLHDAMPTNAIAALEQEVRTLGERIEASRGSHAGNTASAEFGADLVEIRDRLRAMTPPADVALLSDAVRVLSDKADSITAESAAPGLLEQLEHAIAALHGLVSQVASRDAVDGLSRDIHALAEKVERGARPGADADMMMTLDRRLAEMADALGRSRSAETQPVQVDYDSIIQKLADRLEATQVPAANQAALKSLEARIVNLVDKLDASETRIGRLDGVERGMDDLLAQLKELRTQNEKKLQAIQQQLLTSAAEAISVPAEAIRRDVATLKEVQTSADRRTQDTFEAVYGTIEQVVDRLATIEENLRARNAAHDYASGPTESAVAPKIAAAPPIVPNMSALDLPAPPISTEASAPPVRRDPLLRPAAAPAPRSMAPSGPNRQPIVSDLPPDSPLEPGLGARRVRMVANAIDRIAASEATNNAAMIGASAGSSGSAGGTVSDPTNPADTAPPARANFVAAARRAAQAVVSEQAGEPRSDKAVAEIKRSKRSSKFLQKFLPRIKSLVLGISVIMLMLGALRLALDLFYDPNSQASDPQAAHVDAPAPAAGPSSPIAPPEPAMPQGEPPRARKGASLGSPALAGPRNATAFPAATTLGLTPVSGALPEFVFPTASPRVAAARSPASAAGVAAIDTTGSVPPHATPTPTPSPRDPAPQPTAAPTAPAHDLVRAPLPATVGGAALIAAATAGEPGASYEIAIRYSEGRNVPQDFGLAAAWFDRAAQSGMAPAQFRLGSMFEKGLGVKKDLQEARRLYVAAADQGNPKAMHNLAVLYAEGLDGKPDYAVASHWFLKAAGFGVVDSQYNLAILYARGVGAERNIAESYKWFALAAKGGDKDAGKKRDEIAARLDPPQLESAKQAVDTFVAEREPEEATAARAPPGGWDQVVAAAPTKLKAGR